MKVKVRYECIGYNGNKKLVDYSHEIEDYEETSYYVTYNDEKIEIKSNIIHYIENAIEEIDKSDIMDKYNLMCILDWEIFYNYIDEMKSWFREEEIQLPATVEQQVFETLNEVSDNDEFKLSFMYIYNERKELLSKMDVITQFETVMAILNTSVKFAHKNIKEIVDFMKDLDNRIEIEFDERSENGINKYLERHGVKK